MIEAKQTKEGFRIDIDMAALKKTIKEGAAEFRLAVREEVMIAERAYVNGAKDGSLCTALAILLIFLLFRRNGKT